MLALPMRRPMFQNKQWRIFVDDLVQVVTGAEKGASGKVLAVIKDNKQPEVIVEGVNMVRQGAGAQRAEGHRPFLPMLVGAELPRCMSHEGWGWLSRHLTHTCGVAPAARIPCARV